MELDLHGYHPSNIVGNGVLTAIVKQAWEMGETSLKLIHGHGYGKGISVGFVNTNTGFFGLQIRRALRTDHELRQWIKHTTLDRSHNGSTIVRLKPNKNPFRAAFDPSILPDRIYHE
jgi:hypothetical protein